MVVAVGRLRRKAKFESLPNRGAFVGFCLFPLDMNWRKPKTRCSSTSGDEAFRKTYCKQQKHQHTHECTPDSELKSTRDVAERKHLQKVHGHLGSHPRHTDRILTLNSIWVPHWPLGGSQRGSLWICCTLIKWIRHQNHTQQGDSSVGLLLA